MNSKIAVIFPGIGYNVDKPLLYYSKKIALRKGYEIKNVTYGGFERNIKGNKTKMFEAYESAIIQSNKILKDIDFKNYDEILFISKSIGTAVAGTYGTEQKIKTRNIFFTPVQQSFQVMEEDSILFHGTADPWMDHETFLKECEAKDYQYYLIEGGNHSLETEDTLKDLENMRWIMEKVEEYIVK